MADLGLAHIYDMKTNAEMIANLDPYGPPLIADMDTGYGGEQKKIPIIPYNLHPISTLRQDLMIYPLPKAKRQYKTQFPH